MTYKLCRISSRRPRIDFTGTGHLFQFARAQQCDTIGHHHRFFLIMSDKDERDADFALQGLEFNLHLAAQVGVQSGERFVQQQQARTIHQRPRECDALLLSAADL
ncbi:MAG: hypothetical protein ABSD39_21385 [Terriglobales bacterium]